MPLAEVRIHSEGPRNAPQRAAEGSAARGRRAAAPASELAGRQSALALSAFPEPGERRGHKTTNPAVRGGRGRNARILPLVLFDRAAKRCASRS